MRLWKLTTQDNRTWAPRGSHCLLWGENITHIAEGPALELCTSGVIHAYVHPVLAILLNPIHGNYEDPKLWLAEGNMAGTDKQGPVDYNNTKVGVKTLTTIKQIPYPKITKRQLVEAALMFDEIEDLQKSGSNIPKLLVHDCWKFNCAPEEHYARAVSWVNLMSSDSIHQYHRLGPGRPYTHAMDVFNKIWPVDPLSTGPRFEL